MSADAKDLFLTNYSNENCKGYSIRYAAGDNKGEINTRRFVNTLDYSLDLIKLREVYEKVYRRMDFTFNKRGKDYTTRVINVTFKYSVKTFNLFYGQMYIKLGYTPDDVVLQDSACVIDGELVAIKTGSPVEHPLSGEILGDYFSFEDGAYKMVKTPPVVFTVAQLREALYQRGFTCDGIHFVRFKRSSGSSRVGKCLFIDDRMYSRMNRWALCGLKIRNGDKVDLAALEAYIALTLSSIIGLVPIRPENFLVIDDYESVFKDNVIAARAGEDGWLTAEPEEVEVSNSIWDGQSLIDISLMGEYKDYGMILLRNRFFKSACFNCNIQQFFADHGITEVSQLNGRTLATSIEEVKIITTPSSIKYLKFGSLETWLANLEEDGFFGVVKHEKPTHFFDGRMVQIHYQLLNTLQLSMEEVGELIKPSLDYLHMIQSDPSVMRYHIKYCGGEEGVSPAPTANDVVYQMLGVTDEFAKTKLYYDFRSDVSKAFRKTLARGHILVNGNYSTLLGNPVEMLLSSIGEFDGTSHIGVGNVYSKRFEFEKRLLGSRSPHVTFGNVWLTTNKDNKEIEKYCNLSNEIVCINSINENLLMRLSGCDFDSDTALLTDNEILIQAAKKNYNLFLVPTSLVDAKKTVRHYSWEDQADLDIKTSVNKIGEIVNLSQYCNTKIWDAMNNGAEYSEVEELYCDASKLDVLSNIEIDKAKKEFVVDSAAEISKIKNKYQEIDEDGRQVKPNFFGKIDRMKGYYDSKRKNYKFHKTTMDYLQHHLNKHRSPYNKSGILPFSSVIKQPDGYTTKSVSYYQVKRILALVREMRNQISAVWMNSDGLTSKEKASIVSSIREESYEYIKSIKLSEHTAYRLLLALDDPANKDVSRSLFYMLFSLPNDDFLRLINNSRVPVDQLVETDGDEFDLKIYDFKFVRTTN